MSKIKDRSRDETIEMIIKDKNFDKCVEYKSNENKCWIWSKSKDANGYGIIRYGYKNGKQLTVLAHRLFYRYYKGIIPKKLELDHLCKIPSCVNPSHLEAVTHRENLLRGKSPSAIHAKKTHCKNGHEFTKENTYINPYKNKNQRSCIECRRISGWGN